jgi:hypothetical protein
VLIKVKIAALRRPYVNFEVLMKKWLWFIFTLLMSKSFAQQKQAEGIVFNKTSKERIAKVNVRNLRTGGSIYNNLKAEFKLAAQPGDLLEFSKQGYYSDTVKVQVNTAMAVYLKPTSIMLRDVNIRDTIMSPEKRLAQTKREYNKVYGVLGDRDILSVSPGSGAGISIDAIWNSLSRSGRNAEHLKEIIDRDYRQDVIDYRFNKIFVKQITKLEEPQLTNFMSKYRPSYYMVTTANDYDFVRSIKANLKRFLRYPNAATMPVFKPYTPE